jgi:hypothetical protein
MRASVCPTHAARRGRRPTRHVRAAALEPSRLSCVVGELDVPFRAVQPDDRSAFVRLEQDPGDLGHLGQPESSSGPEALQRRHVVVLPWWRLASVRFGQQSVTSGGEEHPATFG